MLFETVTGLLIWLLPLSFSTQFMLLTHTLLGLLMVGPYAWYQTRHWLKVRPQKFSHHKVTGYASFTALTICIVSGVVLSVQAAFATQSQQLCK